MIEKLISAIKARDYEAVTRCFADSTDVRFVDYCPLHVGLENVFLYGSRSVEMFFRDKLYNGTYGILEEQIDSERSATYFAQYSGRYCFVRMTIEAQTPDGLILKAVVRPE